MVVDCNPCYCPETVIKYKSRLRTLSPFLALLLGVLIRPPNGHQMAQVGHYSQKKQFSTINSS